MSPAGRPDAGWRIARRDLAACRVAFAIALGAIAFDADFAWVAGLPATLVARVPGLPAQLAWYPTPGAASAAALATAATAIAFGAGVVPGGTALILAALLALVAAWQANTGKISHDVLVPVALLLLAPAGWGAPPTLAGERTAGAGDPPGIAGAVRARRRELGVHLLATAIGLYMFTGAIPKIASGWLDPSRNAVRYHVLLREVASYGERATAGGGWALAHLPGWTWEALDGLTIAVEAGLLLLLRWPDRFRDLLAVALLLHSGIAIALGIPYWANPLAYLPVLLSGGSDGDDAIVDRWRAARRGSALLAVALAVLAAIPLSGEAASPAEVVRFWICHLGGLAGAGLLASSAMRAVGGRADPRLPR